MTRPRHRAALISLALATCFLLGDDCDGIDRDAIREALAREAAETAEGGVSIPAEACVTLPAPLPPNLSLIPGTDSQLVVAIMDPPSVIPLGLGTEPPVLVGSAPTLPADSDGDGSVDPVPSTVASVIAVASNLALASAQGQEQVVFVDAGTGAVVTGTVAGDARSALRTAVSVTPEAGAVNSLGTPVTADFVTSFTTGSTVLDDRLFVSTWNVEAGEGTTAAVYRPGTILVYDFEIVSNAPVISAADPIVLFTNRFAPSAVTPYTSASGRKFILVTSPGAVVVDGFGVRFADGVGATARAGGIEVIEVFDSDAPAWVAVIDLGERAPGFGTVAVDPTGRIGTIGSLVAREVLAFDLEALDDLAASPPADPIVLDATNAVITSTSLTIAPLGSGGIAACTGAVPATAWTQSGRLLAAEFCDGTISSWRVDLSGSPASPLLGTNISLRSVVPVVDPIRAIPTQISGPTDLVVRRGTPGVDFSTPDVYLLSGLPTGSLCGIDGSVF